MNRLAHESSPYLRQHAHNPVHWQPWGDEAIIEARQRNVPIFVSIGYSTCYWCHVMERESFEDAATAAVMNAKFVNIKVDREERPDLDDALMAAVQMLTGSGGWPMSVFLEPTTLRPFWGGTYFPVRPAHGRPSFTQVLERLSAVYATQRDEVMKQAEAIAAEVETRLASRSAPVMLGVEPVQRAVQTLLSIHDRTHGGFGGAPKFPQPVYLHFLLAVRRYAAGDDTRAAIDGSLRFTLDRMALGGVFDQVGGGFHRYAVDTQWLVPHFEKMLYDQALLLPAYAEAAAVFEDPFYALVARRTAEYLRREMTAPDGSFFTAQDAEVDGREGLNYVWTPDHVRAVLTGDDASLALDVYGLSAGPNFRDPHHPSDPPVNVLRLEARPEAIAQRLSITPREVVTRLERVNAALLAARAQRPQPRLDDKGVTAWNGLMIAGLADAGRWLGEPAMVRMAARAAVAVLAWPRVGAGPADNASMLARSVHGGRAAIAGVLEDYGALSCGLVALRRAGDTSRDWAGEAEHVLREAERWFGDSAGGYFDTRQQDDRPARLFVRARTTYDGAMPSGASLMLSAQVDMYEATGAQAWLGAAVHNLVGLSGAIHESPIATVHSTRSLLRLLAADAAGVHTALRAAGASSPADSARASSDPVEVLVSDEALVLADSEPADFYIRLRMAEGWHINSAFAAEQSGGTLVPLRVGVAGGEGVRAYADYPAGESVEGAAHTVHHGEVDLHVVVERSGAWTGKPAITLTYQACNADTCKQPLTTVLGVRLSRAEDE